MTSTESNVGYSQSSDGYQSKQAAKALFSEFIISRHLIVASFKNSLTIRPSEAGINILLERSRVDIFDKAGMEAGMDMVGKADKARMDTVGKR
jgi:hypothetical protein